MLSITISIGLRMLEVQPGWNFPPGAGSDDRPVFSLLALITVIHSEWTTRNSMVTPFRLHSNT